ncbi:uncharacterized protein METZ01_LOCUS106992 [marine metagenome]|uniref:Uncharacterized protein n=1 Tax=marine metagenome TaxID=408172 RepID=A0A381WPK9_9ZZZZ
MTLAYAEDVPSSGISEPGVDGI